MRPGVLLRVVPAEPTERFVPAALLWADLCGGAKKIRSFSVEESHVRVVVEQTAASGPSIGSRQLRALELLFQGVSQSAIAIDLGVAASTVCADLKAALEVVGIVERVFCLPAFLPQLWRLAAGSCLVRSYADPRDPMRENVWLPRVDLKLPTSLAPAEVEVCRLLLRGCSHEEISRARRRKVRTVANQLASVFAKLKVSGRLELVARLAQQSPELSTGSSTVP